MAFTGKLVFLAATVLAWFVYAVAGYDPNGANPLILQVARDVAVVLSAMLVVWFVGIVVVDGVFAGLWGIPSTALRRFVVYLVLGLTAAGLILKYEMDINIAALLTTSALITVVIGLAAQSTLAALFSGIALQLERHVHPGDIIRVDNRLARIDAIGWRSMAAQRSDGTVVMVPNTIVAGQALAVLGQDNVVRSSVMVPAPIDVPPLTMIEIITDTVSNIAEVSREHSIRVALDAWKLEGAAVIYRVDCFSQPMSLEDDPLASIIRLRLWYAFQRHSIVMPLPSFMLGQQAAAVREATPGDLIAVLAKTQRWRHQAPAELERLAKAARRLLYAPDEPILLPRDLDSAVVIVVSGELRLADPQPAIPPWLEPPAEESKPSGPLAWDMDELITLEARLSQVIGPYARLAVRRAARQTSDIATLYQKVAVLIEDAAARDAFLSSAPRGAGRRFGAGTAFVVRSDGRRLPGPAEPMLAAGPVELWAVSSHRLGAPRQDAAAAAS